MSGTDDNSTQAISKAIDRIKQFQLRWEICRPDSDDGLGTTSIHASSSDGFIVAVTVMSHFRPERQGFFDYVWKGPRNVHCGCSTLLHIEGSGATIFHCWVSEQQLPSDVSTTWKDITLNPEGCQLILSFFRSVVSRVEHEASQLQQEAQAQIKEKFWNG